MLTLEEIVANVAETAKLSGANDDVRTTYQRVHDVPEFAGLVGRMPTGRTKGGASFSSARGVVVPSVESGQDGTSMGFNPNEPQRVRVLGDGGRVISEVAISDFTSEEVNQAREAAKRRGAKNSMDIGNIAMQSLALLAKQRGAGAAGQAVPVAKVAATPPVTTVAVAKQAKPEVVAAAKVKAPASTASVLQRLSQEPKPAPVYEAPVMSTIRKPLKKVAIQLPGSIGDHVCYYHDVLESENLLVLVHDRSRNDIQHVWFPLVDERLLVSALPEGEDLRACRAGVIVYDEDGDEDMGYLVYPTNIRFSFESYDFCLLTLVNRRDLKPQSRQPALDDSGELDTLHGQEVPQSAAGRGW